MILDILNSWHIVAPVLGVAIVAVLIFSYGFKQVSDPPLHLLIDDKRLGQEKKKREKPKIKPKDKKPVQNGQVAPAEQAAGKPKAAAEKNNNMSAVKNVKAEAAKKAPVKKLPEVVPVVADNQDAVDGNWIQVPSRLDKKQKRKTGTPELTDASSAESTPAHQAKVAEVTAQPAPAAAQPEPVPEEPKPVEPVKLKDEVAKQAQNGEVSRAKEGKKPSKSSKGKQEAKQATSRTPVIVVDTVPDREPSPAPEKVEPVAPTKAERIPEVAVRAPVQESSAPLTNGDVKAAADVEQPAVANPNLAFDELGDVWQETRAQKKKKKARRD